MAIVRAFPQFSGGNILRNEMLLSLRGYTQLGDLLYEGYGDGILSGCKLTTTREAIQVGRGVIVYKGRLLMLKEALEVPYSPTDTLCACKLHFQAEYIKDNVLYQEVDAVITEDVEDREGEMELCRFKLQPGAMLRSNYVDFEDRSTEYDTLCTIHSPASSMRGSTLHLDIIKAFALELMVCPAISPLDQAFCMQITGAGGALPLPCLSAYVGMRTGNVPDTTLTNATAYQDLLKILMSVKQGKAPGQMKLGAKAWRLSLD